MRCKNRFRLPCGTYMYRCTASKRFGRASGQAGGWAVGRGGRAARLPLRLVAMHAEGALHGASGNALTRVALSRRRERREMSVTTAPSPAVSLHSLSAANRRTLFDWSELARAASDVHGCALHVVNAAEAAGAKLHPGHRPCRWETHQFSTEEHVDRAMADGTRLHRLWHQDDAASADAILLTHLSFALWCVREKSVPTARCWRRLQG